MPDAIFAHHSNRKGCDFGYALAANSCEGANNVDACTVTALDAITAFAVPNPNGHLAAPSVFSGLEVQSGRPAEPITPAYFRLATFTFASPFLPSTGVILLQEEKLSTPKVGANAISSYVRVALPK
jgi:hypothetical protein